MTDPALLCAYILPLVSLETKARRRKACNRGPGRRYAPIGRSTDRGFCTLIRADLSVGSATRLRRRDRWSGALRPRRRLHQDGRSAVGPRPIRGRVRARAGGGHEDQEEGEQQRPHRDTVGPGAHALAGASGWPATLNLDGARAARRLPVRTAAVDVDDAGVGPRSISRMAGDGHGPAPARRYLLVVGPQGAGTGLGHR